MNRIYGIRARPGRLEGQRTITRRDFRWCDCLFGDTGAGYTAWDSREMVLRAAAGLRVWSAGHDIGELPRGRRDPLAYNDPLGQMLRAIRTFPAPVIAPWPDRWVARRLLRREFLP